MPEYVPELGQAVFGNPTEKYECPEYVSAFVATLIHEISRVFWNREQKEWDEYEDPEIQGIEFHPYCWLGCDCGYEEMEDAWLDEHVRDPENASLEEIDAWNLWSAVHGHAKTCAPLLPNLKFRDGEIHWYKHPGRGMSVNVEWTPDQWSQWFMDALEQIRTADRRTPC